MLRSLPTALLLLTFLSAGCHYSGWGPRISGSGNVIDSERQLSEFHGVSLAGGMTLDIEVGAPQRVVIEADDNLQEYITTRIEDGVLEIEFEASVSSESELRAIISVPDLTSIDVAGSSKLSVFGVQGSSFELDVAGSASGSIAGSVDELAIDIAGSAKLELYELEAKRVQIDIAGSGRAEITAHETLDISIAGSGVVTYRGRPNVTSSQAGSATIRAADSE